MPVCLCKGYSILSRTISTQHHLLILYLNAFPFCPLLCVHTIYILYGQTPPSVCNYILSAYHIDSPLPARGRMTPTQDYVHASDYSGPRLDEVMDHI